MKTFTIFLSQLKLQEAKIRVLDTSIDLKDYKAIDLSINNALFKKVDQSSSKAIENFISNYLTRQHSKVAYGGYLERRAIYLRSPYFKAIENNDHRNIHLGLDLWVAAGTRVLAPLKGQIHSFKNNLNLGDYGPTIILKHRFAALEFYTLYGHLSLASLKGLKVGTVIEQGQTLGTIGDSSVNGDYAPHLHFQLINDIGSYQGDYPGVCSDKDLDFYKHNCPDPNLVLKLI